MDAEALILIVICLISGVPIIIISCILMKGKGAFLISGYNTMKKEKREQYDTVRLCKFVGKMILPLGVLTALLGFIMQLGVWAIYAYLVVNLGICIFMVVYMNTGNRFKRM